MKKLSHSEAIEYISRLSAENGALTVAIDGRCASGKTTFAAELESRFSCTVFHADDFFLRPEQKTEARMAEPGGNFDRERFKKEILEPIRCGKEVTYRPYICKSQSLGNAVTAKKTAPVVIEGSYCLHPELRGFYDLRIFSDISSTEQKRRILLRNPDNAEMFFKRWIPLEERYFTELKIRENCDIIISGE